MITIYKLTCLPNRKAYVGQTNDMTKRMSYHKYAHSMVVSHAIRKHGWENFRVEELAYTSKEDADLVEAHFIKEENSLVKDGFGYNVAEGGRTLRGYKRPAEVGRKISASLIGRKLSPAHRQALSEAHKGYKHTDEQRKKISESLIGNKNSLGVPAVNRKAVRCVETGVGYASLKEATLAMGGAFPSTNIRRAISNDYPERKIAYGYRWEWA